MSSPDLQGDTYIQKNLLESEVSNMLKFKNSVRRYGCVPVASGVLSVVFAFPAFASGSGTQADITGMLALFTQIAAWLWKEIGIFCTFDFGEPLIMLAFAIPFVGVIVNFFVRIFKTA